VALHLEAAIVLVGVRSLGPILALSDHLHLLSRHRNGNLEAAAGLRGGESARAALEDVAGMALHLQVSVVVVVGILGLGPILGLGHDANLARFRVHLQVQFSVVVVVVGLLGLGPVLALGHDANL